MLKDFSSISASMLNWLKGTQNKITDFNIGSVARTLVEAPAAEIDELYQQMFNGLKEGIPVATYNSFNFAALPATSASGLVRVTITPTTSPVLIPNGTTATVAGFPLTYASQADVTIPAGASYADVLFVATTAGSSGSMPAGQSFTLSPAPTGFVSASNLAAFSGSDAETDDARKLRFADYINTLDRGTVAALIYGLKTTTLTDSSGNVTERVATAAVIEPYVADPTQPIALVNCYIHNGVGSTSSALVTQATKVMYGYYDANGNAVPGWKAAGVNVTIAAATEVPINIGGTLTALPGYDKPTLDTQANQVAAAYILGLDIGATFQVATLVEQIMQITGVQNFVPADVNLVATPALGHTAGGTLAATTYYVAATYVTATGETLPSPTTSLAVSANNVLTVASPPNLAGVTGWNVYIGTSAGALQKQNTTPIAIGTAYTEPTTGLVTGASPPTASTARLADIASSGAQKLMPGTMGIA